MKVRPMDDSRALYEEKTALLKARGLWNGPDPDEEEGPESAVKPEQAPEVAPAENKSPELMKKKSVKR